MKVKIIFLLILFSIKSNCQLKRMTKYYDKQINAENQDNAVSIYKIKGKKYITDRKTFFLQIMDTDIYKKTLQLYTLCFIKKDIYS